MERLLPIPRASAAVRQQITRAATGRWRPRTAAAAAAATASDCWSCGAMFSTTARLCDTPARRWTTSDAGQAMPRGAYYDVLITSPPPYSNDKANEPPVTSQTKPPIATKATTTTPAAEATKAPDATPPPPKKSTFQLSEAPAVINAAKQAAAQAAAEAAAEKQATKDAAAARARIVFGSRLAGPMERENRLAEIRKRSKRVAGVLVPPKPTEPDNCCMSGCVNCVWDRFRDEMEEWALANAEVQRRLAGQKAQAGQAAPAAQQKQQAPSVAMSMDDDGGGSDTNWSLGETVPAPTTVTVTGNWEDEIFKDVPVGIREFMKQEKRLKLKHMQEGSMGG